MTLANIAKVEGARRSAFPETFAPMLASPTERAFSSDKWIFEPKLDGIRCLVSRRGGKVTLLSRRGLDMTQQYPALVQKLETAVTVDAVLDGEIIALDEAGKPSFQQLQQRLNLTKRSDIERADARIPAFFFAFDVLFAVDSSLNGVPLMERKSILNDIVQQSDSVRVLMHFEDDGAAAYNACVDHGFEGIVAKRRDSRYEMGRRSPAWLKLKAQQTGDFVLAGFTAGEGWRTTSFGSLLLAYNDGAGKLIYAGSVGSGFDDKLLRELMKRFEPLLTKKKNFAKKPEGKTEITWLEPQLVVEIKFMDWTDGGHLRNPVFLRLRDDKTATEILRQLPVVAPEAGDAQPLGAAPPVAASALLAVAESTAATYVTVSTVPGAPLPIMETLERRDDDLISSILDQLNTKKERAILFVGTETVSLSTLDKPFWPAQESSAAITKRQYLAYLAEISPYLLPHLAGRPITVVRAPNGVSAKPFFQKHWKDLPEFFETTGAVDVDGEPQEFLLCNNLPTLLYLGQHSSLELHTMCSRLQPFASDEGPPSRLQPTASTSSDQAITDLDLNELLEFPDYIVLDLDAHDDRNKAPAEVRKEDFVRVCEVALALREPLANIGATPLTKVSGKGGLHIYVPIQRNLDYDQARVISETLAKFATTLKPQLATTAFNVQQRAGKIYVDTSSNIHRKTMIAPYSPRLTTWGTVSMPVSWTELEASRWIPCAMSDAVERLRTQGDLWKNILTAKIDMHRSISAANKS